MPQAAQTMNPDALRIWLEKNKSRRINGKILGICLSFIGGVFVLAVTFVLIYFITWLVSDGFISLVQIFLPVKWRLSSAVLSGISGVFIILLFRQSLRADSWSWKRYSQREFDVDPRLRSDAGDLTPFVDILARPRASANLVADVLVTGPRMLIGTFVRLNELARIKNIDTGKCSAALAYIYYRADAVPYEEFSKAGWGGQLEQLRAIDGVCFLKAGLLLSDELRLELNDLR